jgi:hypothetical protein
MKCRVAHPLRLIAFDVGDTPRHCVGDLRDDTLLSGWFCELCEPAVVARVAGATERTDALHPNHIEVDFSPPRVAVFNVKIILN